jgi:hypothetical protein
MYFLFSKDIKGRRGRTRGVTAITTVGKQKADIKNEKRGENSYTGHHLHRRMKPGNLFSFFLH